MCHRRAAAGTPRPKGCRRREPRRKSQSRLLRAARCPSKIKRTTKVLVFAGQSAKTPSVQTQPYPGPSNISRWRPPVPFFLSERVFRGVFLFLFERGSGRRRSATHAARAGARWVSCGAVGEEGGGRAGARRRTWAVPARRGRFRRLRDGGAPRRARGGARRQQHVHAVARAARRGGRVWRGRAGACPRERDTGWREHAQWARRGGDRSSALWSAAHARRALLARPWRGRHTHHATADEFRVQRRLRRVPRHAAITAAAAAADVRQPRILAGAAADGGVADARAQPHATSVVAAWWQRRRGAATRPHVALLPAARRDPGRRRSFSHGDDPDRRRAAAPADRHNTRRGRSGRWRRRDEGDTRGGRLGVGDGVRVRD